MEVPCVSGTVMVDDGFAFTSSVTKVMTAVVHRPAAIAASALATWNSNELPPTSVLSR